MVANSRAINRVFTRKVIQGLLKEGSNEVFDTVVKRYIVDPEGKTYGELFSEIYLHLGKENRNEYYYTNTLLDKLLVGIHSVNTTTALSQVRINQHIADFVMINGTGRVYEIKSDLDNFDRLLDQIRDYYKAFSYVSVLTTVRDFEKVLNLINQMEDLGDSVGIYTLNQQNKFFSKKYKREPKEFNDLLSHESIFKILRKAEYESVVTSYYSELPETTPVTHFRTYLGLFQRIPILEAQKYAFVELKKRNKIEKTTFEGIPKEMKSVIYFSNLSKYALNIETLLKKEYKR